MTHDLVMVPTPVGPIGDLYRLQDFEPDHEAWLVERWQRGLPLIKPRDGFLLVTQDSHPHEQMVAYQMVEAYLIEGNNTSPRPGDVRRGYPWGDQVVGLTAVDGRVVACALICSPEEAFAWDGRRVGESVGKMPSLGLVWVAKFSRGRGLGYRTALRTLDAHGLHPSQIAYCAPFTKAGLAIARKMAGGRRFPVIPCNPWDHTEEEILAGLGSVSLTAKGRAVRVGLEAKLAARSGVADVA